MSMNCYFTVAYGVSGEGDVPEKLEELMNDDCEAVLSEGIRAYTGYNEGTGKETWQILIERTTLRCDHRGSVYPNGSLVGTSSIPSPTYGEIADLMETLKNLDIKLEPGHLFLVDVL